MSHVLLYDGDCGLCSRVVQFVLRRDRRARFRFAALQSGVGQALLRRHAITSGGDTFYVVPQGGGSVLDRSRAALFVAAELGLPWSLARVAAVIPRRLRDRAYDVVARNRHRLLRAPACALPDPAQRERFLDRT